MKLHVKNIIYIAAYLPKRDFFLANLNKMHFLTIDLVPIVNQLRIRMVLAVKFLDVTEKYVRALNVKANKFFSIMLIKLNSV